jgi:DedD protein
LELLVKERLTGAIILVVLIVLLVPELLSGPKGPAVKPAAAGAASPSSEEPPLRSYTINLGDEHSQSETANGATASSGPPQPEPSGPAQPVTQATPDKDVSESSTWDTAADSQAAPVAKAPAQPSPSVTARQEPPKVPPSTAAASKGNQPTPNVAARAEQQKAAAGATRTNQPTPSQTARGESKSSQAANAQAARTAAAEKSAAKSRQAGAGQESGGWGVQLGVFASKENAERLALEVRVKGFKASVSPTSGKRKLYRVRVGPAPDRSAAQELQGKLKAAGRSGGTVVPYS